MRDFNSFFGREPGFRWSYQEERMLVEVASREAVVAEFEELKAFRKSMPLTDRKFFPGSVLALLEKWESTLDRSRNGAGAIKKQTAAHSLLRSVEKLDRQLRNPQ